VGPTNLRPLGIGETLDVAIKVYRARFRTLVRLIVIVVAPVQVINAIIRLSLPADTTFRTQSDPFAPSPATTPDIHWRTIVGYMAANLIVGLLGYLAGQLATAASLKDIASAYLGEAQDNDWRPSLRFATQRLRSVVWVSFLIGLLGGLGFLACIVPGVYFFVAWSVAMPALLLENERGRKALRRSRRLVKGRWWQVFACVALSYILAFIVQAAIAGVLFALVSAQGNDVVTAVAQVIAGTVSAALVTPFTAAVIAIIYFDLRVRKEGFDLELLAQSLGTTAPAGPPLEFLPPPLPDPGDQPPFWPPPPGWQPRS
jgi:hypothetical protein